MSYKTTSFFHEFTIHIKASELNLIHENITHVGDWLKYYKSIKNITSKDIALAIGVSERCISKFQKKELYVNRKTSNKLAIYFNLTTKYFHDQYFEDTEDIDKKLKQYRKINNLKIYQAANKANMQPPTWSGWENGTYMPSRENYYKLKELGII
ncbi:helix-turn-helix domain-containing protein [Clostridium botulinum]|nr:helix-turn-helix domain-containing protein [Clostridium botulinum]